MRLDEGGEKEVERENETDDFYVDDFPAPGLTT